MRLNLYNPWLLISLNKEMLNKILLRLIMILFITPFNLYSMVNDDIILSDIPPKYLSQKPKTISPQRSAGMGGYFMRERAK